MVKILIRFDDICPTMNYEQFMRAMVLLDKYNIKPLLGVIPDCCDPDLKIDQQRDDFWDFVRGLERKGYTIAMHGFQHVFTTSTRGIVIKRHVSEFAGHNLSEQIEKVRSGKEILASQGIYTNIFFAPAHSYDENTIKALSKCGFKYMSDGKSSKPYVWHGVKCLPDRAAGCPRIKGEGCYTAVFHAHEWVLNDKSVDYEKLVELISNYRDSIVSFDEYSRIPSGNLYIELVKEKIYVFFERYLLDVLRKIKFKLITSIR